MDISEIAKKIEEHFFTTEEKMFIYIVLGAFYNKCNEEKDKMSAELTKKIMHKIGVKTPEEVKNERKQKKTTEHRNSRTI